MEAEVEAILKMSETLESSGFARDQSDAFIQSVALSMKTFAVTPDVLDDRLGKLNGELQRCFDEIYKLREDMHALHRSQMRYLFAFTLVILAGLMGTLGAVLAS